MPSSLFFSAAFLPHIFVHTWVFTHFQLIVLSFFCWVLINMIYDHVRGIPIDVASPVQSQTPMFLSAINIILS